MLTLRFNEVKTERRKRPPGELIFSCDEMSDDKEKWKINFPLWEKQKNERRSGKENKKIMSFFTCLALQIVFTSRL